MNPVYAAIKGNEPDMIIEGLRIGGQTRNS